MLTRYLMQVLTCAAVAALVGFAPGVVRATGRRVAAVGVTIESLDATVARGRELRAAREQVPRGPMEKAARTRRPSGAGGAGALPALATITAAGAPVILLLRGSIDVVTRPSECGHCTRAPRPPPVSQDTSTTT